MAAHSYVIVGVEPNRVIVDSAREAVPTAMAALFSEHERVSATSYVSSAGDLRIRLHLLGYDKKFTTRVVEMLWLDRINVQQPADVSPSDLIDAWIAHIDEPGEHGMPNKHARALEEQWGTIWGESRRQLRYLLDRIPADTRVELDLSEPVDRGYVPPSTFALDARNELANEASGSMPTIVLTEGSTDAEALTAAVEFVRPGLAGFLTFINYGLKPDGGVGAVTNGMKAFASAGVANRVTGLFDNDTAGADGKKALKGINLPDRIRAVSLPPLDLARAYPTLGPTGPQVLDVNGRAVSIEFFFGRDVLTDPSGALEPVQWTRFIDSQGEYQGEFLRKREIQQRFRAKVVRAREGDLVASEWADLAKLLDYIADS
ncbi:hypothetical protein [Microbacterium terrisoli]|uniref:hypothetical protein n=1 Tax=Microbacterium terrisoli TaxID=3242192 RepID=UPI0028041E98|nr:hypothetical protein [Microbacterium protaetiae]